jgi:hypothetical protein
VLHPCMTAKGESVGDSRGISRPRAGASLLLWLWTQRGAIRPRASRNASAAGWGAGRVRVSIYNNLDAHLPVYFSRIHRLIFEGVTS